MLRGLPFYPNGHSGLLYLTDRWGERNADPKCARYWDVLADTNRNLLIDAMVDGISFVVFTPELGYGLLLEQEYTHSGSDDMETVRECWGIDPADSSRDNELTEANVAAVMGARFARESDPNGLLAVMSAEEGVSAWISGSNADPARRIVAQCFIALDVVCAKAESSGHILERAVNAYWVAAFGKPYTVPQVA